MCEVEQCEIEVLKVKRHFHVIGVKGDGSLTGS
jgi:hypothetical protein